MTDSPRFLGVIPYTWSLTEVLALSAVIGLTVLAVVGIILWAIGPVSLTAGVYPGITALLIFAMLLWLRRVIDD